MRDHPAPNGLLATFCLLLLALVALPAVAQDGESAGSTAEETTATEAPPPRSGSIFGARPPQLTTGGDDLISGEVDRTEEEIDDGRLELVVFDLEYALGIEFRDSYLERFETTFWETVGESAVYRPLTPLDRQRRMAREAQLATADLREEDAERIAEAIGVDYYLIPRVEVADSRSYRIRMTFGRAGEGDGGRRDFSRESSRSIDNVDNAIETTAAEAVAE